MLAKSFTWHECIKTLHPFHIFSLSALFSGCLSRLSLSPQTPLIILLQRIDRNTEMKGGTQCAVSLGLSTYGPLLSPLLIFTCSRLVPYC